MLASGIVRPGPLALGLDVAESDALIRADGEVHDRLFAIGPLLKEHLWETTAVRELRGQTLDLARRLLTTVEAPRGAARALAEPAFQYVSNQTEVIGAPMPSGDLSPPTVLCEEEMMTCCDSIPKIGAFANYANHFVRAVSLIAGRHRNDSRDVSSVFDRLVAMIGPVSSVLIRILRSLPAIPS